MFTYIYIMFTYIHQVYIYIHQKTIKPTIIFLGLGNHTHIYMIYPQKYDDGG